MIACSRAFLCLALGLLRQAGATEQTAQTALLSGPHRHHRRHRHQMRQGTAGRPNLFLFKKYVNTSVSQSPQNKRMDPIMDDATTLLASKGDPVASPGTQPGSSPALQEALPKRKIANAGDAGFAPVTPGEVGRVGATADQTNVVTRLQQEVEAVKDERAVISQLEGALQADVSVLKTASALHKASSSGRSREIALRQVKQTEALLKETTAMLRDSRQSAEMGARSALQDAKSVEQAAQELSQLASEQLRLLARTNKAAAVVARKPMSAVAATTSLVPAAGVSLPALDRQGPPHDIMRDIEDINDENYDAVLGGYSAM